MQYKFRVHYYELCLSRNIATTKSEIEVRLSVGQDSIIEAKPMLSVLTALKIGTAIAITVSWGAMHQNKDNFYDVCMNL